MIDDRKNTPAASRGVFLRGVILPLCLAVAAFGLLLPGTASAQDWKVEGGKKRKQKIIKRYKKLLERTPTEGLAFKKLLEYVGKGRGLDRLVAEYRKKVENDPEAANYRLILGHLLKAKGEYEPALEQYDKAVELGPDDPTTWLSRGAVRLELKKGTEASADFEKALELEDDRNRKQEILRKLADLAFSQRDWEAAETYYDQLIALDPRNEYLRMEYAQVLVQYKRYEKALEQYDKLIELAGRDTEAKATTLRDMGDLYERMGKDDKAIEIYRKAMGLVRSGKWLHRELQQRIVGVYRRSDRLGELAEEYSEKWRRPNYDRSMLLASIYDELGKGDEALKYYRRAARLSRRSVDPRLAIIRIMERRGEDKKVIREYRRLIRVAPREFRYQFDLVRHYFRLGDRDAAEKLLRRIERRFPRDPDVHGLLADTYMRFDMKEKALKMYKKLVRMDPKNDAYILSLGEYYYQNGEIDKAVDTWVKLLDSSLEEAEAHAKLGQVLAEHGLVEKGLDYFEKAVEIAPDDLGVRRGLALAYERARRWNDAVETWTFLLENTDQPLMASESRSRIINIYRRQNRLRSKMREFAEKFRRSTPDINAGFFLAEAYLKTGEFDEAETIYKRLVELARHEEASDDPGALELDALHSLDKLYQQTGELEQAIDVLRRLAELRPARARDYYHRIADLSLKLYEDDQAVHYARLAVEGNPDDPMAQARLGDVYAKMQKLELAADQYRTAIDLDPRAFSIYMKLAEILLEVGKLQEAEKLYRKTAQKANDETLILRAARRAMSLAEVNGTLEEVEEDFFPLVYRTPPKPVYRKIMLELYDRMSAPLVAQTQYGVSLDEKVRRKLEEMGQRALPVLVDALQSKDVGQKALAVRLLGDFREGNGALPLARMVDDEEEQLRVLAAVAVAKIGDPRATEPLIRVTKSSDPNMRELAIWALGATGGEKAVSTLSDILVKGQSWGEQALAAVSLGRIGTDEAVDQLVDFHSTLTSNSFGEYISVAVVWGLGQTGSPKAVDVLRDSLKSSSDRIASMAAWSLARLGGEPAVRALLRSYWRENETVRQRAGRGLIQFASGVAVEGRDADENDIDLGDDLRFIDDREQRVYVEQIIQRLEDDARIVVPADVTPFLTKHGTTISEVASATLKGDASRARLRVLQDFSRSDGRFALGIVTATSPGASGPRQEVLGRIVDRFREPLRRVVSKQSSGWDRAVSLLGALGHPEDRDALLKTLEAKTPQARARAALGLASYDAEDVDRALLQALRDDDFRVREAAARAWEQRDVNGGTRTRTSTALVGLLKDDFASVQVAAADALGELGAKSSVAPLIDALSGTPIPVQEAVLRALVKIDTPESRRALQRYKQHPNAKLRRAAGG